MYYTEGPVMASVRDYVKGLELELYKAHSAKSKHQRNQLRLVTVFSVAIFSETEF